MLPVLVLVTVAATALLYVRGDLNPILCDGPCPPEFVTPPEGLVAAAPGAADPVGVAPHPQREGERLVTFEEAEFLVASTEVDLAVAHEMDGVADFARHHVRHARRLAAVVRLG